MSVIELAQIFSDNYELVSELYENFLTKLLEKKQIV